MPRRWLSPSLPIPAPKRYIPAATKGDSPPMLALVFQLISIIVNLILVVLVVQAVLSWLIAFEVVDRRNNAIASIYGFTQKVTEPMLRPIRRLVGPVGGIDLAPLILALGLIFGLQILQTLVFSVLIGA